ncbi:MAG: cytochrome c biogenesis protein CcsA [Dongiaceae bacterium]
MATGFNLHRFANPGRFLRLTGAVLPWLAAGSAVLFAIGIYFALLGSPPDYQRGDTVRDRIHVPSAWMAMMGYALLGLAGQRADLAPPAGRCRVRRRSPVGAGFTFVALVTGSLWGKPTWGTYWVWDARLTSFLVLFFLYVGHIALTHAFDDRQRGRRSAIIAIVGVINLPIIKYSVDWWNTLHQSESITCAWAGPPSTRRCCGRCSSWGWPSRSISSRW